MKKIWLWRAWTADRERICDCGYVFAHDEQEAVRIAWVCSGGPHKLLIDHIQTEEIRTPWTN